MYHVLLFYIIIMTISNVYCVSCYVGGIAVNVARNEHSIDWGNARVVRSVWGYWERRATEAIRIRSCNNSMNLDNGLHLPAIWNSYLGPNLEISNNAL